MADNTIAENRDEGSFIWDNYYDADEKINEYDLTLFIKEQSEDEDASTRSLRKLISRDAMRFQSLRSFLSSRDLCLMRCMMRTQTIR